MIRHLVWLGLLFTPSIVVAQDADVVIYGGTSGGVAAAVQVRRMGKTALLIEPGRHLGGLTSGGLGATDISNKAAIGGIAREFYGRVWEHYQREGAWKFQRREDYLSGRQDRGEHTMWTFEPHVAEQIMQALVQEAGVQVVLGERLDLKHGVTKEGTDIVAIHMESGRAFHGSRFLDATYEGDLMALAGVSFHVGREARTVYDESLNGVQTAKAVHHQLQPGVDPYVKQGDPTSGLLPGVLPGPAEADGSGDARVQAY
jgi:flavin-dependent dehydrogenase